MQNRIDIKLRPGREFRSYKLGRDAEVMDYISSANIACGWHAGDPLVMETDRAAGQGKGGGRGGPPRISGSHGVRPGGAWIFPPQKSRPIFFIKWAPWPRLPKPRAFPFSI